MRQQRLKFVALHFVHVKSFGKAAAAACIFRHVAYRIARRLAEEPNGDFDFLLYMSRRPLKYQQVHLDFIEELIHSYRHRYFTLEHLKEQMEAKYPDLKPVGQSSLSNMLKLHLVGASRRLRR